MALRDRIDLAQHQGKIKIASFFLLFTGFLLFLLTNLGTPITKSIYLMSELLLFFILELTATTALGLKSSVDKNPPHTLRWGVWGVCTTGYFSPSINDPPTTSSSLHLAVPTIGRLFWVTRHVPSRHWDIQHLKSTSRASPM